jgi:hypothetical protein
MIGIHLGGSPMPDWSIKIVPLKHPTPDVLAEFVADVPDAKSGSFDVQQGDLVSWNNTATQDHWPWLLPSADAQPPGPDGPPPPDEDPNDLGKVKPSTSTDYYNVGMAPAVPPNPPNVLYYCCRLHPAERGRLVVVPFGQSSDDDATV